MNGASLVFAGVTREFAVSWGSHRVRALDALTLSVPRGALFGLLGPNGSGKSTALKIALGLLRADAGFCEVLGEPAGSLEARAQVGYLPDAGGVPLHLTGREGLVWFGRMQGLDRREARDRAAGLLEQVGLDATVADRPTETYSKGMRQRLGLAQALMPDPELLLLDEPFAGLDPLGGRRLVTLLRDLQSRGKTVVFTSHLLERVGRICDGLALLHRGTVLAAGSVQDVLGATTSHAPDLDDVFIGRLQAVEVR